MAKRVCYIHIGPHKTGTSSIQAFLKEILLRPVFAVEAAWNDLLRRAGWTPRTQIQEPCR